MNCQCEWCRAAAAYNAANRDRDNQRRYPGDTYWRRLKMRAIDRFGAKTVLRVVRLFDRRVIGISSAGTLLRR